MAAEVVDRETGELTQVEPADFPDVRLDKRFVQLRQGRHFVAYPGLLDALHQLSEGFFAIDTEVLQLPTAENRQTAVCQARVQVFDPEDAGRGAARATGSGTPPRPMSSRMMATPPSAWRRRGPRPGPCGTRATWGWSAWRSWGRRSRRPSGAKSRSPSRTCPRWSGIEVEGRVFTRPQVVEKLAPAPGRGRAPGHRPAAGGGVSWPPGWPRCRAGGGHAAAAAAGRGHPGGAALMARSPRINPRSSPDAPIQSGGRDGG